jgi:hypothetical protein
MSISSEIRRAGPFAGNGSTVNFPFTFKVFTTAQVVVTRTVSGVETVLTLTTDYTVSLNSNQDTSPGGTVTMLVAPTSGQSITITSNVANLQPTVLANLGGFYPEVINDSLDRATIQIQQLDERVDRALIIPVSSTGVATQLPAPQSNNLLAWNAGATQLVNFDPDNLALGLTYGSWTYQKFTGNGSQTAFVLSAVIASKYNVFITINGLTQVPDTDYSIAGSTVTFVAAPALSAEILARWGSTRYESDIAAEAELARDAAIAAKIAAELAETNAETAETNAETAETNAETAEAGAVFAKNAAEVARDAAQINKGLFASTAAALGNGVQGHGTITGGSGGTNGTFPLITSGGTQVLPVRGTFVVSGGAVTEINIYHPGYYSSNPTGFNFTASSGLTSASATPTVGPNTVDGEYFHVPSALNTGYVDLHFNNSGVASVIVATLPNSDLLNSIDFNAVNESVVRVNLFNAATITDDFFVNHITGALQANNDYWASDYIPVEAGEDYIVSRKHFRAWYDAAQVFISGASDTGNDAVITAPANTAFLRLSAQISAVTPAAFMVQEGTSFRSGGYVAHSEVVDGAKLLRVSVTSNALALGAVEPDKTGFLTLGKNLFNKQTITPNSFAGSTGSIVSNTTYALSDFIEVEAGETYYGAGASQSMRFWTAYDEFKRVVSAEGSNVGGTTITVPASGVKYYRVTLFTTNIDSFQFEKGTAATAYEPYRFNFDYRINVGSASATSSNWSGKAFLSYGDSLTAQASWQPSIATALGLIHTGAGVGGRRISGSTGMWVQATIDALPTGQELIIVLGGTNDWAGDVQLGTFKTAGVGPNGPTTVLNSDTDEFYGALNTMIERLQTKYTGSRICLATPPWSELPGRVTSNIWSEAQTNDAGLTIVDYGDAMAIAATYWGLPFIDFRESGINTTNKTTYMSNDGGWIHPNTAGGKRLAEVAIGRLRDIEPLN